MRRIRTYEITITAVMTALATIIYLIFPEIPLVPGVDYLKIDFSDIPAIAAGIVLSPFFGIFVEIIKNIFHLFRTTTFGIGEIMNVIMGSTIIVSLNYFSNIFYKKFEKYFTFVFSSVITIAISIVVGWLTNAIFTPIYFLIIGIPITQKSVLAGVIGSTLLNAVKVAFNILPFYPLYFALKRYFSKINH